MSIAREEIFGPVLSIILYSDADGEVALANDTRHVITAHLSGKAAVRARREAERIVAGRVLIHTLSHEPRAPFGGF